MACSDDTLTLDRLDLHRRLAAQPPDLQGLCTRRVVLHMSVEELYSALHVYFTEMPAALPFPSSLPPIDLGFCLLTPDGPIDRDGTSWDGTDRSIHHGMPPVASGRYRFAMYGRVASDKQPKWWNQPSSTDSENNEVTGDVGGVDHGEHPLRVDHREQYTWSVMVAAFTVAPLFSYRLDVLLQYVEEVAPWVEVLRREFGVRWEDTDPVFPFSASAPAVVPSISSPVPAATRAAEDIQPARGHPKRSVKRPNFPREYVAAYRTVEARVLNGDDGRISKVEVAIELGFSCARTLDHYRHDFKLPWPPGDPDSE